MTEGMSKTPMKGQPPPPPIKAPANPTMGKYFESYPGAGDWYVISGGKPLADWSSLDPAAVTAKVNPRQFRPLSAALKRKAYDKRVEGLQTQFKQGDNLSDFRDEVHKHFVKNGLDTITYLPDLATNKEVYNIVTEYPRFVGNLEKALESAKKIQKNYDELDEDNSEAALEFLFNSLEDPLRRRWIFILILAILLPLHGCISCQFL